MQFINIAIDGPAGAGKSTISKIVAKELGYLYVDTGAMYRAAAYQALTLGINIKQEKNRVIQLMDDIHIRLQYTESGQQIFLNDKNITAYIRTPQVSVAASDIAVIPEVREKLVELQKEIARNNNVVMDGRDIGTNVLPNAKIKIFLTASLEDRAQRRYEELLAKGMQADFASVKEDMAYRDKNDSSREYAPLKAAEDAILLDTSGNTLEHSVELMLKTIKENLT